MRLPFAEPTNQSETAVRRCTARRVAAALAAAVAVMYGLIAAQVVTVMDGSAAEIAETQLVFGTSAAVAYVVGVVLLLRFDRQVVWVLGALLQLAVIAMYLNVATEREPAFEVWGVTIRVFQVLLLGALGYLVLSHRQPGSGRTGSSA